MGCTQTRDKNLFEQYVHHHTLRCPIKGGSFTCIASNFDGTLIVGAYCLADNCNICIWQLQSERKWDPIEEIDSTFVVRQIQFSKNKNIFMVEDLESNISLYKQSQDILFGEEQMKITGQEKLLCSSYNESENKIYGGFINEIIIWQVDQNGYLVQDQIPIENGVYQFGFNWENQYMVTVNQVELTIWSRDQLDKKWKISQKIPDQVKKEKLNNFQLKWQVMDFAYKSNSFAFIDNKYNIQIWKKGDQEFKKIQTIENGAVINDLKWNSLNQLTYIDDSLNIYKQHSVDKWIFAMKSKIDKVSQSQSWSRDNKYLIIQCNDQLLIYIKNE